MDKKWAHTGDDFGVPFRTDLCPQALRAAFGTFATGVTVVLTRRTEKRAYGITANSFTSVSLAPPLLLVCIAKNSSSHNTFATSGSFSVNVLCDERQDLSARFAARSATKFDGVSLSRKSTGAPVLTDALTWFDCTVHERIDAGDHMILIGKIEAFASREGTPLVFSGGRYRALTELACSP